MDLKFLDSKGHNLQEITQWDINRKVEITGIQPHELIEVHFYNAVSTRALVVDPVVELEKIIVDIPNILVQQATDLFMAVFVKDGKEGKTEQIYSIPVRKKKKPESYTYEENIDYVSWVELSEKAKKQLAEMQAIIDDVNNKLQSGEFEGNGIKSITKIRTEGLTDTYRIEFTKGQPFEYNVKNGYTPVKGKDYFTEQEKAEMVETTKTKVVTIVEKDSANSIDLSIDSNYLMTAILKNKQGQTISTATIDFPIESMVVNASYSNGKLTLTLQNGNNLEVDISAIVSGLVNETTFNAKVKELNQQIANANQEIDQLTGEVSDIKLQQGTFKQEQTLQNANIGKNTNDIHTLINAISTISPAYDKETAKAEEITITDGTENPAKIEIYGNTKQETREETAGKTINGEEIIANDVNIADGRILVRGNTKQATTKGNQLFACNGDSKSVNGVTMTNDNGLFTITGKATKTLSIELTLFDSFQKANLEGGQEYTQQVFDISGKRNFNIITAIQKVSGEVLYNYFISSPEFPTITKNIEANSIGYTNTAYIAEGQEVNCSFKVMLTKGKEKAIWEEYTGGQASPNPEYPQEIESVEAYNLINSTLQPFERDGIKCEVLPDKSFRLSGTATKRVEQNIQGNFTLPKGNYKSHLNVRTIFNTRNTGYQLIQPNQTIRSEQDWDIIEFYFRVEIGESINQIIYPMITTIENQNKPYQQYQQIEIKQTGKNLFNKNDTNNVEGYLAFSSTGKVVSANTDITTDYIKIAPNTQIIRSDRNGICEYDKNKNFISGKYTDKFTTSGNCEYVRISAVKSKIDNTQLIIGNVLPPYEPYKETIYPLKLGNIELNKIGDSQDYFHKVGNNWYLKNNNILHIFNGEETITYQQVQNEKYILCTFNFGNQKSNSIMFCNSLKQQTLWNIPTEGIYFAGQSNNYCQMKLLISRLTTPNAQGILQYLKNKFNEGNPIKLYYELETPTETLIEEPTLISQLNALEKAKIFTPYVRLTNNSIADMELRYNYIPAMPSPEAESNIESVKGNVEIKQTGKNLCSKVELEDTQNILFYLNKEYIEKTIAMSFKINEVLKGNSIYLIVDKISLGLVRYVDTNINLEVKNWITFNDEQLQKIKSGKIITLKLYKNGAKFKMPSNVMINNGKENIPYEPYQEHSYPIKLGENEMNKIGNAQDYFHRINEKWHLHKEIGKYNITGNEDWSNDSGTIGNDYRHNILLSKLNIKAPNETSYTYYSNRFIRTYLNDNKNVFGRFYISKNWLVFTDKNGEINSTTNWKQWLKDNPTYIIYQLETPEEIEILDTTLIEQLDNLEKVQTFKGTNILTNNSIAEMKLNYKADTKIYLDNLFPAPEKQAEITQ